MVQLLPAHYALSEAILAFVVALWVFRLARCAPVAALALAPFGLAALIGTIRIGFGLSGGIVDLHQFISRSGALFGLSCLIALMMEQSIARCLALGIAAAALGFWLPQLGQILFVGLILGGAVLIFRKASTGPLFAAISFTLLLGAQIVATGVRASSPAIGWHLFHGLVAVWIILTARTIRRDWAEPAPRKP